MKTPEAPLGILQFRAPLCGTCSEARQAYVKRDAGQPLPVETMSVVCQNCAALCLIAPTFNDLLPFAFP